MADRLLVAYSLIGLMAVFLTIVVWRVRHNSSAQVQRRALVKERAITQARKTRIDERSEKPS